MRRRLFGTDGVRGILNESLDPILVHKLAMSICTVIGEGSRIIVGRDVRLGGDILELALASGLLNSGCKPVLAGLVPTPALQLYVAKKGGFDGGLMITASHNPPQYNGVKLTLNDGIEAPREIEEQIENVFFEEKYKRIDWKNARSGVTRIYDVNDFYVEEVVKVVDQEKIRKNPLKVVIDAANSVGALTLPEIVRKLGGKPIVLNGNLDPFMSGREPEPTAESLRDASNIVKSLQADVGIGVDGDADRSIIIDEKGNIQWGDRTALIIAPFLREKHPDLPARIYTGISTSSFIEPLLRTYGINIVWLRVGSPVISRALKREGGLLGFEENGGIMYPNHHPVRDSGVAIALIMELIASSNKKLSDLYSIYPKTTIIKTKVPKENLDLEKMYRLVSDFFKKHNLIYIDGIKIVMDDSWILVRPSGTEPVVRIMIESLSREKAEELLTIIKDLIEESRVSN